MLDGACWLCKGICMDEYAPAPQQSAEPDRPALRDDAGAARAGDRQRGIDRVIGLLQLLQRRRQPMSAGEIARAMGAPRSTVYEIVNRLLDAQMLEAAGDGQVYFGRAMHLFGVSYMRRDAGMRRISEALDALSAETGATVQLCAMRGDKYVVLDCRDGAGPFRITSEIGAELPLPWTASGRIFLRHLDEAAIRAFIPAEDYRMPDGRMLPVEDFLADVAQARRDGYAETIALANSFTRCQAVPILSEGGAAEFTLCFMLPIDVDARQRDRCLVLLQERARLLSQAAAL